MPMTTLQLESCVGEAGVDDPGEVGEQRVVRGGEACQARPQDLSTEAARSRDVQHRHRHGRGHAVHLAADDVVELVVGVPEEGHGDVPARSGLPVQRRCSGIPSGALDSASEVVDRVVGRDHRDEQAHGRPSRRSALEPCQFLGGEGDRREPEQLVELLEVACTGDGGGDGRLGQ